MSRSMRSISFACAVFLAAAACGPSGTGSPSPRPSPAGSGDCPAASDPGELPGWGVPAEAPPFVPVIATVRLTCGPNRILIGLLGQDNRPIADPDQTLIARFFDLSTDPSTPVAEAEGTFAWAIPDVSAVYVLHATFPHAGIWGAEIEAGVGHRFATVRLRFEVAPSTPTVRVGDKAPASDTPTVADAGGDLARLSTDEHPEPRFYDQSVADALAARKPFVLAFATPKFCKTAVCGPVLDRLKPVAAAHPAITFINVEPYRLDFRDGQLEPVLDANDQLQPVPAVEEWGLLTEPTIFVVDAAGTVRGAFEGTFGDAELEAVLEDVTS